MAGRAAGGPAICRQLRPRGVALPDPVCRNPLHLAARYGNGAGLNG